MQVLFLHHNFPGQFRFLLEPLMKQGWDVSFASEKISAEIPEGLNHILVPSGNNEVYSTLKGQLECAQRFYDALKDEETLRDIDVVVSHTGWGCGLHTTLI